MMANPMQMILQVAQMAANNPQAAQALQLIQGKTPQQLQRIATNMAQQMGTTPEAIAQSLGLPMRR